VLTHRQAEGYEESRIAAKLAGDRGADVENSLRLLVTSVPN
jgi:hypothetical protein